MARKDLTFRVFVSSTFSDLIAERNALQEQVYPRLQEYCQQHQARFHSRYALPVTAWNRVTGPIVLATFGAAAKRHGPPAATLTDNGMVFTARLSGGKSGRNSSRARTAPPGHHPKKRPPQPPANPRARPNGSSRP